MKISSTTPRDISSLSTNHSPPPTRATPPARTGHIMESSFEDAGVSKQGRVRTPPAARASRERVAELLRPETLRALNPGDGDQNCPAAAGAVDHFLRTGEVRPADAGNGLVDYTFPNRFTDTSITGLHRSLSHDGDFAVVRGIRDPATAERERLTPEHYFVVVNDGGELRAVDAFSHDVTPLDDVMSTYALDHLQRTTGEFNPTTRDPFAGGDMPPM